jgi:hypothetical protein
MRGRPLLPWRTRLVFAVAFLLGVALMGWGIGLALVHKIPESYQPPRPCPAYIIVNHIVRLNDCSDRLSPS